jgi:hypothetical protein
VQIFPQVPKIIVLKEKDNRRMSNMSTTSSNGSGYNKRIRIVASQGIQLELETKVCQQADKKLLAVKETSNRLSVLNSDEGDNQATNGALMIEGEPLGVDDTDGALLSKDDALGVTESDGALVIKDETASKEGATSLGLLDTVEKDAEAADSGEVLLIEDEELGEADKDEALLIKGKALGAVDKDEERLVEGDASNNNR